MRVGNDELKQQDAPSIHRTLHLADKTRATVRLHTLQTRHSRSARSLCSIMIREENDDERRNETQTQLPKASPEDWLEERKRIWTKEQELIASQVKVYNDPTTNTQQQQQRHDRNSNSPATVVVEDTSWCKVLRTSFLDNDKTKTKESSKLDWTKNHQQQHCQQHDNRYYFGGVDVGWPNPPNNTKDPVAVAVYVVIDARTMEVVYRDHDWIPMSDLPPYISTFLAFREIDPLEKLVRKQLVEKPEITPAAILVDGNGIFHPRHSGIACFLGVRTGIPTIGIGKTLLFIENKNNSDCPNNDTHSNSSSERGGDDEYRWSRRKLDERIDGVLADMHRRLLDGDEHQCGLAGRLEAHRGLLLSKGPIQGETIDNDQTKGASPREQLLKDLAPFCNGITTFLEAPNNKDGTKEGDDRFRFLGAALFGHGGGNNKGKKPSGSKPKSSSAGGSKRPIIVSVGHKVSLAEAVSITASMSLFRIPEPVREADLWGRELLRKRNML